MKKRCYPTIISTVLLTLALCVTANDEAVYEPDYEDNVLYLQPLRTYQSFTLTVKGPNETKIIQHFEGDETPYLTLYDHEGRLLHDGLYTFELRAAPLVSKAMKSALVRARAYGEKPLEVPQGHSQSGSFYVADGQMVLPAAEVKEDETPDEHLADVINEDQIVIGNQCVGLGCLTNESFGDDTLRLKQEALRINFEDTSSGTVPGNDWRLMANDTADGGLNYFGIEDSSAGRIPFRIEAGSPANSLYVDAVGEVGIGTSTPLKTMHLISGNAPTIRLEQDGSEGFGTQSWDLTSNEANFYIGDASNGNKLPLRIEVNSPTNSLYIATDGVGLNTYEPSAQLDVVGTSELNGDVAVTGATTLDGDVTAIGATSLQGNLTATGTTALQGDVTVSGAASLNNGVTVTGETALGNVSVNGISILRGPVNVVGPSLTVMSPTTLQNGATINGATTLNNGVAVTGVATLGDVTVSGTTTLNNGVAVTGAATLENVTVSGATTLNDGIAVTGTTTLEDVTVANLNVAGDTTLNGNVNMARTDAQLVIRDTDATARTRYLMKLENKGPILMDMNNTDRNVRWELGVDNQGFKIKNSLPGGAILQLRGDAVELTGNMTVTGDTTMTGATTMEGDLNVSGTSALGNVTAADVTTTDLNATGVTATGATALQGGLNVSGGSGLTVTGATNLSGNVTTTGNTVLNGDLNVTEAGACFTVQDTTETANTRYLMKLENKGPILMDMNNTDKGNRWELGVDNQSFKIKNSTPGGAIFQLKNDVADLTANLNVSATTDLGGALTVAGTSTLANVNATDVAVSGATDLAGDLTVTGATALNDDVKVEGPAVDLVIKDTTGTLAARYLMRLENSGPIIMDLNNTYNNNRWEFGVDSLGLKIRNNTAGGAILQLRNTGEMTVITGLGTLLTLTSTGDLILRGDLQFAGSKALSTENAAMKQQLQAQDARIESLSEENEAMNQRLLAQEARLQALEAASYKRQVSSFK